MTATIKTRRIEAGYYIVDELGADIEHHEMTGEWIISIWTEDGTDGGPGSREGFDTLREARQFAALLLDQRRNL